MTGVMLVNEEERSGKRAAAALSAGFSVKQWLALIAEANKGS